MATKPIQFKEDFIPRITAEGVSRGDALSATSLLDVQSNRTDIPVAAIEKRVKFLNDLGFGDITLGEIKEGGPKRDAFIKALVKHGKDTRSDELVGDFKKILGEVGLAGARGANPFRAMMKETVGEADYLKAGFSTVIDRKIPLAYPPEVYTEVKKTVAGLLGSEDPARKAAGVRMLMMMQGGYRPSDFKGLRVENINFETGIVKGLDLKTDSKDNVEGKGKKSVPIAYMPSSQRDVIRHHIGSRTNGLVFESPEKLDKIINEELGKANIPEIEYYSEGTGTYVKEKFSAYDFRRLMETHLSAQGYNETSTVRRALTWRPQEGNVQKYQAVLNEAGRIEQANAASFQTWVLMSEGNAVLVPAAEGQAETRVRTHGQFLTEVGITEISPYTARYAVTGEAVNNLPPFMQERARELSQGVVFANDNINPVSVDTDPGAARTYQETAKVQAETGLLQAEIDKRKKGQELADTPQPVKPTATAEAASGATAAEMYPDAHEKLGGSDKTNFLTALGKKFGKNVNTIIAGLTGGATFAALMEDAGAVARDVAIESAAVAAKVPLKVAGAIPMILEPSSRMAGPELTQPSREEQDMARMAMEPSDMLVTEDERIEDMERMAIADAGFVSRNREPEAAPAPEAGFITR